MNFLFTAKQHCLPVSSVRMSVRVLLGEQTALFPSSYIHVYSPHWITCLHIGPLFIEVGNSMLFWVVVVISKPKLMCRDMIHATFQNLVNGLKVLTDISILAIDFCVKVHSCWRLLPQEPRHTKIEGIFCAIFFLRIKTDENMVHFWHFLCYISVITFFNSRFQPSIFFFFKKN